MLNDILPKRVFNLLPKEVTEVRVRRDKPLVYYTTQKKVMTECLITQAEFDYVLSCVTERSLYAVTEKLVCGFLPLKDGLRVGIAGEGVAEGEKIKTVKHITSLSIRIPHQIFGIANFLGINGYFKKNVLIVSPPAAGKTTLLREIARTISDTGQTVVILDERGEISGVCGDSFSLKIGKNTDVLFGFPKRIAYENALRALNPDYLITDELSGEKDVEGVLRAYYGGVKVIATLHGASLDCFHGVFEPLKKVFDHLILLSKVPRVGTVVEEVVL
ncbi:MAG TPA: hypothetical protein DIC18_02985 [Clostridiales bacterium]|nr:hypothetical protein [Clostridiales bacterium]